VTDPIIERARKEAVAVMPGLAGVPVEAVRIGIRPMPRDGQPIVGFDPQISGLYSVVTHSGITLAARLALLVTEELSGGDTSELEPYRPTRFVAESVS
jgi:glycine/D-amino acid oxidase-like deaminating enzyme